MKVLVSTYPFAEYNTEPLDILKEAGCDVILNTEGKKFGTEQFLDMIEDVEAIISGTEKLDENILKHAKKLKVIARVGVGLDNVDFDYTNSHDITVTYTPDAPSRSVAELTIGHILMLARKIGYADSMIKKGNWKRETGVLLQDKNLGIVGAGRIGKHVIRLIQSFGMHIIATDIKPDHDFSRKFGFEYISKERLIRDADFISLHIPLNEDTHGYISEKEISEMKDGVCLINTSRGGVVDEAALLQGLKSGKIAGAGLDVFETEPYNLRSDSDLARCENVVLTPHMGSCTRTGRYMMEFTAARSIVDIIKGRIPKYIVGSAEGH